jgi:putative phosphoesterase
VKLAVLADIHANFVAMQTVIEHIEAWQPDRVVVAGDVVNRGPRPLECLRVIEAKQQRENWLTVRGNHEDYVLSYTKPDTPDSGLKFEIFRTAYWTYQQLNGQVETLRAMPFKQELTGPAGEEIRITHASMLGNRNGIFPKTTEAELRRKIAPAPALFCVGHTHWPLIRTVDETLVVNVGSAGLPFDGDRRVSYAQLTWQRGEWQAEIIRLNYDYEQTERDFYKSGFMADSGALAPLVMNEFLTAQSRLYAWTYYYEAPVLAGEITLEESVRQFLSEL